jgi:hypothetical protein
MESRNLAQAFHTFIHARVTAEVQQICRRHAEGCDKMVVGDWADCDCDADGVGDDLHDSYVATLGAADRFFRITQDERGGWAAWIALDGLKVIAGPFEAHPAYPQDVEDQS